ncbi:hypothetical protein KDH_79070 [Dictyobacter sp. S3.2.2.5]|uniref:Uncharacterized protein n=1 Tax=Dictyobacter halimunensis TaxID=3026934 RepID=A0ABQ6G3J4_9CHLR|nr:hypothetical protein KDH_79070 [Dictyobacter sp. S3.2.2.5]
MPYYLKWPDIDLPFEEILSGSMSSQESGIGKKREERPERSLLTDELWFVGEAPWILLGIDCLYHFLHLRWLATLGKALGH